VAGWTVAWCLKTFELCTGGPPQNDILLPLVCLWTSVCSTYTSSSKGVSPPSCSAQFISKSTGSFVELPQPLARRRSLVCTPVWKRNILSPLRLLDTFPPCDQLLLGHPGWEIKSFFGVKKFTCFWETFCNSWSPPRIPVRYRAFKISEKDLPTGSGIKVFGNRNPKNDHYPPYPTLSCGKTSFVK